MRVVALGPHHYRVSIREDPDSKPDMLAGIIEEGLRRAGVTGSARVTLRTPRDYDVEVRW